LIDGFAALKDTTSDLADDVVPDSEEDSHEDCEHHATEKKAGGKRKRGKEKEVDPRAR